MTVTASASNVSLQCWGDSSSTLWEPTAFPTLTSSYLTPLFMNFRLNLLKYKLYQFLDIALVFLSYLNPLVANISLDLALMLGVSKKGVIAKILVFFLLLCSVTSILVAGTKLRGCFLRLPVILNNLIIFILELILFIGLTQKP